MIFRIILIGEKQREIIKDNKILLDKLKKILNKNSDKPNTKRLSSKIRITSSQITPLNVRRSQSSCKRIK